MMGTVMEGGVGKLGGEVESFEKVGLVERTSLSAWLQCEKLCVSACDIYIGRERDGVSRKRLEGKRNYRHLGAAEGPAVQT